MAKLHFRPYIPNQTVLFPQRIDENIAANDPVRIVNTVVDNLNLDTFKKLYKDNGRCPYHPKMMLKVIIYAYMNNIYSCRKIEKLLLRDIHYIWLSGNEHPDFITINRFRNRVSISTALRLSPKPTNILLSGARVLKSTVRSCWTRFASFWNRWMKLSHKRTR